MSSGFSAGFLKPVKDGKKQVPVAHGSQVFSSPGTYTFKVPWNVDRIYLYLVGGGGSGGAGGYASYWSGNGGGGGAGALVSGAVDVNAGEEITIVVGAGSIWFDQTSGSSPQPGAATTVTTSRGTYSAGGGGIGGRVSNGGGGTGGVISGPTPVGGTNLPGASGSPGINGTTGGKGADSFVALNGGGVGGAGSGNSGAGAGAVGAGGGGGGPNGNGGAGYAGYARITW